MMKRRGVLAVIGMAALGGVKWCVAQGLELKGLAASRNRFDVLDVGHGKPVEQNLGAEMTRIGSRVYSEEGVPMFLACQNMALAQSTLAPAATASLNRKVASAFSRYAKQYQQVKPDATAADVAKIIELLAERDFAAGGTETGL